ncbi:DUF1320 family protein [Marinifilum flexuosum]|uniref:Uncharacterized protein DUF1320 n=1 Tax=Marinifilum flexuosum TaxID=1117708 RepID=A0A419X3H1_9BACT|nr:DUF1320 family protein [Marinifilum flexuosum]RKE02316.1 uncharacterized protein DUF1320 [Marinifilum flexuosum]
MDFLTEQDFKGTISTTVLNRLRGENDENLNEAEQLAISELATLRGRFDIDAELGKVGAQRNEEIKRMMVTITVFYLYNTVIDDEIPERVDSNYTKEVKDIRAISSGKMHTTLKPLKSSDGTNKSKFRSGGDAPRNNSIF